MANASMQAVDFPLAEICDSVVDRQQPCSSTVWYLEGHVNDSEPRRHVNLCAFPFRIGRLPDLALCLPSPSVSKLHAEIWLDGEQLLVRDLGSTNGTFVNGRRVQKETGLSCGDLLQFANLVFHVRQHRTEALDRTVSEIPSGWIKCLMQFDRLMTERAVVPYFQPIVVMPTGERIGFEILARSRLEGLENPGAMFSAAAQLNLECELSSMLRTEGARVGRGLAGRPHLFLNTHPKEMGRPDLIASLAELRRDMQSQPVTVEIHEGAVTDMSWMHQLRDALRDLDMRLAYDDFGAGQARLLELTEVPPDYVKFDINLIRNIHLGNAGRQQTLQTLVRMVRELGIATLAEGTECAEEVEVCRQIGFDYAQGYYFGRPAPITDYPRE
jgi:EAL domain-containing protein (putative c-di-GMP-specific phosphodiesterase class I)